MIYAIIKHSRFYIIFVHFYYYYYNYYYIIPLTNKEAYEIIHKHMKNTKLTDK